VTKELETFRMTILNEDNEFSFVALVARPAIQNNLVYFSDDVNLKISLNEELRIITTPVLIPNQKIYRNIDGQEFNLVALEEDVSIIYEHFMKSGKMHAMNLEHNSDLALSTDDAFLLEVFMSDTARGISAPKAFKHLPNKTWFASYKIVSEKIWNDIKEGNINGVSIEANLGLIKLSANTELDLLINELEIIIEKI